MSNRVLNVSGNVALLTLTLAVPTFFVAFNILRHIQLSSEDPCNNPYTNISTICLLGFLASWLVACILVVAARKRLAEVLLYFSIPILGLAFLLVAALFLGLFMFIFP